MRPGTQAQAYGAKKCLESAGDARENKVWDLNKKNVAVVENTLLLLVFSKRKSIFQKI